MEEVRSLEAVEALRECLELARAQVLAAIADGNSYAETEASKRYLAAAKELAPFERPRLSAQAVAMKAEVSAAPSMREKMHNSALGRLLEFKQNGHAFPHRAFEAALKAAGVVVPPAVYDAARAEEKACGVSYQCSVRPQGAAMTDAPRIPIEDRSTDDLRAMLEACESGIVPPMLSRVRAELVVESSHARKHVLVTLPAACTLESAVKDSTLWSHVQGNRGTMLGLFDIVDLLSADGTSMWSGCVVKRVTAGGVWLSKPAQMLSIERPEVVFEDTKNKLRIVPCGAGYSVQRETRDGGWAHAEGGVIHRSESAARHALHAFTPRSVA